MSSPPSGAPETPGAPEIAERTGFRASGPAYMATIAVGHGFKHWYLAAFAVFLPLIEREYAMSALAISAFVTVRSAGAGLPNFFAGYVADRLHRHWAVMLPVSFLAVALAMMLAGFLTWVWGVALAFSLAAMAASFWHPPAISMLSSRFAQRRGMAIAFPGAGSGAGEALGPLGVGLILVALLNDDWRFYVLVSAAPAVVLAVALYWMLSGAPPIARPKSTEPVRLRDFFTLLRYPVYRTLAYANFSRSFAHFGLLVFLPLYLANDLGMDSRGVGFHIALLTLLGVPVGPLFGYLSDRIGRRIPLVVAMGAIAVGMAAMGIAGSGVPLMIAIAFTGVFLWTVQDVTNAAAMDSAPPNAQGTVVGFMFATSFLAGLIAPVLAGVLVSVTGDRASVFFLSAAVMAPVPLVMAFAPLRRLTAA